MLWDTSEPYRNEGKDRRWIFDVRPVNGELVSEDNFVCLKLRQAGIKVLLDPSFTCTHIGLKQYKGDFAAYVSKMQAAAKANAA